jgi:hypothetical protein
MRLRSSVRALGRPGVSPPQVGIVDFKSGAERQEHRDDARFYALLECLRNGVPPFRIASYYLDSGEPRPEDVNEGVLEAPPGGRSMAPSVSPGLRRCPLQRIRSGVPITPLTASFPYK